MSDAKVDAVPEPEVDPAHEPEPGPEPEPAAPRRGLAYSELSEEEVDSFYSAGDNAARMARLCELLGITRYATNPRAAIFADFCFHNLAWARDDAGFDAEQSSAFFSIMRRVFDAATSPASVAAPTADALDDAYGVLRELTAAHAAVADEPAEEKNAEDGAAEGEGEGKSEGKSEGEGEGGGAAAGAMPAVVLFNVADADKILAYASSTFFRHFKLYKYTHAMGQPTECATRELLVEEPLLPPPLIDGVDAE